MRDLIIVGAGSAARDYLQFVKDINKVSPTFIIKGFIADSGVDIKKLTDGEYDILGTVDGWVPDKNEEFLMGAAEPAAKYVLAGKLKAKGARFATLIHPSAVISEYAEIGEGCIVCPFSKIGANASVGGFVTVDGYIGHDNYIEDFVTLSTGTRLTGYVSVGSGTFFGAMCCVKPHTKIGGNCFVTIGSTVVQDIPDNSYVKGTPEIRTTQNKRKFEGGGGGYNPPSLPPSPPSPHNSTVNFLRTKMCGLPVRRTA